MDRFVVSVARHVAGVLRSPALAAQGTGEPMAVVPFMNCTVPVIAGPPLKAALAEAVRIMLPPEVTEVALEMSVVVLVAPVTVTVMAGEVEAA